MRDVTIKQFLFCGCFKLYIQQQEELRFRIHLRFCLKLCYPLQHAPKGSPSPSSQHTFSEYDYNSQDDFSGLSLTSGGEQTTPTPSNYNSLNLIDDSSPLSDRDLDVSVGGQSGSGRGLVLPGTELNGTPLIIPPASEDEADSAISGKSSEINENR